MKTKLLFTALFGVVCISPQIQAASVKQLQQSLEPSLSNTTVLSGDVIEDDYTSYVINAACSEWWTGWVRNVVNETGGYVVNTGDINSDVYGGPGIEFWAPSPGEDGQQYVNKELLYQTVTGLPYGRYKVSAVATGRRQDNLNINDGRLYFFANDAQQEVTSVTFQSVELESPVGFDGLKLGLAGGDDNRNHWVALSNVKLSLLNNEASLTDAITAAKDLRDNIIKVANNEEFNQAISSAEAVGSGKTSEEYKQAIASLNAAVITYLSTNVTSDNPLDITDQIDNIGLNDSRIDGWISNIRPTAYYMGTEFYNCTAEMHRMLNLIPGKYRIKVQARCNRQNNLQLYAVSGANQAETYVNQATVDGLSLGGENTFQNNIIDMKNKIEDQETWTALEISVVDGSLDFGLKVNSNNNGWSVINEFKVEYLGMDVSALWQELLPKAQLVEVDVLPETVKNNFEAALNKENPTYADVKTLDAAIVIANASVEPYAHFNERYPQIETYNNETLAEEAAEEELTTKLSELRNTVEATLDVSEIENAYVELLNAAKVYSKSVYDVADGVEKVEMNFLLENMDISSGDVAPWKRDVVWHNGDNFRTMAPNTKDLVLDIRYIECYINRANVAECGKQNLIYQTVSDMPVGKYSFKAASFNRRAWFENQEAENPIELFLNGISVDANSQQLEYHEVNSGSNDGTLTFGIRSGENFNTDWNGIGDAHLYYLGAADDMRLNETDASYAVSTDTYTNVVVERSLKAEDKWNTFCVPFDMSVDQLSANEITEVRKLESAETQGENVILTFSEPLQTVEAGVPYIVKASSAVSQIEANGVVVKAAAPASLAVGDVIMQGNYGSTTITGDNYFISDNVFYRAVDKNVTVNGFRSYIRFNDAQAAGVNRMLINIDGEVTGIETVAGEVENAVVDVYSIDGRCLKSDVKVTEALEGLHKGIYIVGGKKVVIK